MLRITQNIRTGYKKDKTACILIDYLINFFGWDGGVGCRGLLKLCGELEPVRSGSNRFEPFKAVSIEFKLGTLTNWEENRGGAEGLPPLFFFC